LTLTDALRAPSEATSPCDGEREDGRRAERQIGPVYSVGPSQIGMVGARVSGVPWLGAGPSRVVYSVPPWDVGDPWPVGELERTPVVVQRPKRTLQAVVDKAGKRVGSLLPTDTGKRLVWVSS